MKSHRQPNGKFGRQQDPIPSQPNFNTNSSCESGMLSPTIASLTRLIFARDGHATLFQYGTRLHSGAGAKPHRGHEHATRENQPFTTDILVGTGGYGQCSNGDCPGLGFGLPAGFDAVGVRARGSPDIASRQSSGHQTQSRSIPETDHENHDYRV